MNLETNTSSVLRYGAIIGIIIVAVGAAMHLIDVPYSEEMMTAGIATIILTPFAGLLVSFAALSSNGEKRYAIASLALIAITILGMLIAFWLR